jgi:hypothetical protein
MYSTDGNYSSRRDGSVAQRDLHTRKKVTTMQPFTNITVSYNDASESVQLTFGAQQTLNAGGEITVLGGPTSGVKGISGALVSGNRVLVISPGGARITPV